MIAKLLPVILLLVGLGGGIGAGIVMAPAPEEAAEGQVDGEKAEAAEEEPEESEVPREFVKLNNQFVVPIVEKEQLAALVIMSLSLEVEQGMREKVYAYEPKLRDIFLQVLFDHANMGGFNGAFTRSDMLDPLRTALNETAKKELGKGVRDVLIMEIARQDV
jgi:flagellar basal body-associated protein FliL